MKKDMPKDVAFKKKVERVVRKLKSINQLEKNGNWTAMKFLVLCRFGFAILS